jgi:CubicO group peptidase (beta-lactamase class C family)
MSAERLAAIDRVVLRGIHAGGFPGAAVVVGRDGYAVVKRGYGRLTWEGDAPAVSDQTIYDLASLTKVVATTSAIMVLVDEGKVDLDAPVRNYLPEFAGGAKDRVTVRHLLTHRSGSRRGATCGARRRRRRRRGGRCSSRASTASPAPATSTPTSAPTCWASSPRRRAASASTASSRSACSRPSA